MKIHSVWLGLVLAGVSCAGIAQWQWLDNDGRKVYSDRSPPPDIPEKNILKRPGGAPAAVPKAEQSNASSDAAASAASATNNRPLIGGLDKDLEAKKKQAADAEAAKRKAAEDAYARARGESCARAKQARAVVDSGVRMTRPNAAGEMEVMDDAARASERKRIQSVIDTDCN